VLLRKGVFALREGPVAPGGDLVSPCEKSSRGRGKMKKQEKEENP